MTQILGSIPGTTSGIPATIDLDQYSSKPPEVATLLQQLQDIKALKTHPLTQDSQGLLHFQIGTKHYAMRPVQVTRAGPGTPPGIHYSDQGTLQMVTQTGRRVSFIASADDPERLEQYLATIGMNLDDADESNGNLTIHPNLPQGQAQQGHLEVRPALYSEPEPDARRPGVYWQPRDKQTGAALFKLVFEPAGQSGELRQQAFYAVPHDGEALNGHLQQQGYQNVRLNPDGIVQFDHQQQCQRAVMDGTVDIATPEDGLRFEAIGGLNKDGRDGILVIYPDGSRQGLFLLPPASCSVLGRRAGWRPFQAMEH